MDVIPTEFDPTGCRASEKLDGVQARWDGARLTTRTGNVINQPDWWMRQLPSGPSVGELWCGRGTFETLQSIVCRSTPDDRWEQVRFVPFDTMEQITITSPEHLDQVYQAVVADGGEDLVITTPEGVQYKRKPIDDDDGRVVDHIPGAGKYEGLVNGLILKTRSRDTVRVSAGLTQSLRINPPKIGTIVKFQFNGRTHHGRPRFPRFDSIRAEDTLAF